MIDLNSLSEFSRANCIALCAFLVPANLLLTLYVLVISALGRPQVQINRAAAIACIPAIVMILHVWTWFAVGVVMPPTYILLFLGTLCLSINGWAMAHSSSMARLLRSLWLRASFAVGWVK